MPKLLSNAFLIVEEDNGALSPFDLADIFPQPVETIPNTNTNNLVALASPQTMTTSLGKHALASAEVAAVTPLAETTATATKKTTTKPLKKVKKSEVKKSVREKARRDSLNVRFEDLSRSLLESADDELITDKLSIVIAARECILVLREEVGKLNARLAAERSESAKTTQELIAEKILVLQQLSLFQTARPSFTKCVKTLNSFVKTFFSPDVFFGLASSVFWSFVFSTNRNFSRISNLTIQARTTILQNKYSYLNAVKRSINTSSTPLIILINESRLRLHS